jgi:hypothetical protein
MLVRDGKAEAWPNLLKTEIADRLVEAMIVMLTPNHADREPANV